MRLVIIETPYSSPLDEDKSFPGTSEANLRYARACMADSIRRGEAPFASHLLYTQLGILDDTSPEQRDLGMCCGAAWVRHLAEWRDPVKAWGPLCAVYTDLGLTSGMKHGIQLASARGIKIVFRSLHDE